MQLTAMSTRNGSLTGRVVCQNAMPQPSWHASVLCKWYPQVGNNSDTRIQLN